MPSVLIVASLAAVAAISVPLHAATAMSHLDDLERMLKTASPEERKAATEELHTVLTALRTKENQSVLAKATEEMDSFKKISSESGSRFNEYKQKSAELGDQIKEALTKKASVLAELDAQNDMIKAKQAELEIAKNSVEELTKTRVKAMRQFSEQLGAVEESSNHVERLKRETSEMRSRIEEDLASLLEVGGADAQEELKKHTERQAVVDRTRLELTKHERQLAEAIEVANEETKKAQGEYNSAYEALKGLDQQLKDEVKACEGKSLLELTGAVVERVEHFERLRDAFHEVAQQKSGEIIKATQEAYDPRENAIHCDVQDVLCQKATVKNCEQCEDSLKTLNEGKQLNNALRKDIEDFASSYERKASQRRKESEANLRECAKEAPAPIDVLKKTAAKAEPGCKAALEKLVAQHAAVTLTTPKAAAVASAHTAPQAATVTASAEVAPMKTA